MGTYLKIAPQNSDVAFSEVSSSTIFVTNLTATTLTASDALFTAATGSFSGSFSGNFSGSLSSATPFFISASKGYLSYVDSSVLTVVSTGSVANIFLVQDATGSAFAINGQGVTVTKIFTGTSPTPVTGGIYFTSTDMYIGTQP
jgi:hypothetical protein